MSLSYDTFVGNGSLTDFTITFPYNRREQVVVTVNGTPVTPTWLTPTTFRVTPAPANGATVRAERQAAQDGVLVTFQDGVAPAAASLNEATRQALYAAQEAFDKAAGALDTAQNIQIGTGNVPSPSPADVGRLLRVVDPGVFQWAPLPTTGELGAATPADLAALLTTIQDRVIGTGGSLQGGGSLAADRTLQLVNDAPSPGVLHYYGTGGTGIKGFFPLPLPLARITVFNTSGTWTPLVNTTLWMAWGVGGGGRGATSASPGSTPTPGLGGVGGMGVFLGSPGPQSVVVGAGGGPAIIASGTAVGAVAGGASSIGTLFVCPGGGQPSTNRRGLWTWAVNSESLGGAFAATESGVGTGQMHSGGNLQVIPTTAPPPNSPDNSGAGGSTWQLSNGSRNHAAAGGSGRIIILEFTS